MRKFLSLSLGLALGIAFNVAGAYAQCSQWVNDAYGCPVQMAVPCAPPPPVFDPLGAFFGGLGAGIAGGIYRPGYGYGGGWGHRGGWDGGHRGFGGGMQRREDMHQGGGPPGQHRR